MFKQFCIILSSRFPRYFAFALYILRRFKPNFFSRQPGDHEIEDYRDTKKYRDKVNDQMGPRNLHRSGITTSTSIKKKRGLVQICSNKSVAKTSELTQECTKTKTKKRERERERYYTTKPILPNCVVKSPKDTFKIPKELPNRNKKQKLQLAKKKKKKKKRLR